MSFIPIIILFGALVSSTMNVTVNVQDHSHVDINPVDGNVIVVSGESPYQVNTYEVDLETGHYIIKQIMF